MKVKKALVLAMVVLITLVCLTACSFPAEGKESKSEELSGKNEDSDSKIKYEQIKNEENIPPNIKSIIESLKKKRGFAYFQEDEDTILFISMGEKNTAGYEIKVKSIEAVGDTVKVIVSEKTPGKDEIVAQVITYPYTIVRVEGIVKSFKVVNEKGEEFNLLSSKNTIKTDDNKHVNVTGTYIGQIDNNSIEIDIADDLAIEGNDSPMAFRLSDEVKAYFDSESSSFKDFKEGEQVIFSFIENDVGQKVITEIEKIK